VLCSALKEVWHLTSGKILGGMLMILAILGLFFTSFFIKGIRDAYAEREAYEAQLDAAEKLTPEQLTPNTNPVKSLTEVIQRIDPVIESLGLAGEVRGYRIYLDLRPADFVNEPTERAVRSEVFLNCGCQRSGMYDVMTMDIDPRTLHASVRRSDRHVSLQQYITIHSSEERR
jgi:hypothetical protein